MLDHLHASETYAKTHIEEYTHRPLPDSADEAVSGLYLPIINAVERLTSLTWRIGADGLYVEARLDLLWWGDVSIATNAPKVVHVPPGLAVVVYDSVSGTILHVHEEADRTLLATSSSDARRATDERL